MPLLSKRFQMGRLVATPAAIEAAPREVLLQLLERHLSGDWGDVSKTDAKANEYAISHGLRIISWYQTPGGERIQIITEADRSVTTILLAKEY